MRFLLIPGAGGQGWYWQRRVAPILHDRGHEVVTVDLPAADPRAGLAAYVDAAVRAAGPERMGERLVVVGQSLAGFIAPQAAVELGAEALVLVNAMIPAPGETPGAWFEATGQPQAMADAASASGREPHNGVDPLVDFLHDLPPDVHQEALERGDPVQADTPFADPWPLPAWPAVPTEVIAARDDRMFPADLQRRVAQERLGAAVTEVAGGHLVALSRPVALVEALLATSGAGSPLSG